MAPRKNEKSAKNLTKSVEKAVTKTRNLKTPLVTKLAIPSSANGINKKRSSKKKTLTSEEKISLANEVAKAQLVPGVKIIEVEEPQEVVKKPVVKRVRKKANTVVSEFFKNADDKAPVAKKSSKALTKKAMNDEFPDVKTTNVKRKRASTEETKIETEGTEKPKRKRPVKQTSVGVKRSLRNKRPLQGKEADTLENNDTCELKHEKNNIENNDGIVVTRRSSLASISNLSWTKDISSSSANTMVAVSSIDIVRMDNKIPILNLANIGSQLSYDTNELISNNSQIIEKENECKDTFNDDSSSSSSSNSTNSSSSSISSANTNVDVPSLNLSKSIESGSENKDTLSDLLAQLDLININWTSNSETCEPDLKVLQKITSVLDIERNIMLSCRQLRTILDDDNDHLPQYDDEFIRPAEVHRPLKSAGSINSKEVSKYAIFKNNETNVPDVEKCPQGIDNSTLDRNRNVSYDGYDDDALSLFAESITGIESSRASVQEPISNPREGEMVEYVPHPINKSLTLAGKYEYCPTKIDSERIKKAVYENQNSACKNKDPDNSNIINNDVANMKDSRKTAMPCDAKTHDATSTNKKLNVTASAFKSTGFYKSNVFHDICIFNLKNSCKYKDCRFQHFEPDPLYVIKKLCMLSDDYFIREYMLIRTSPVLMVKYGVCFFEECKRRNLLGVILEMVIDFSKTALVDSNAESLKVAVAESALLYLNNLDLTSLTGPIERLFLYKISPNERLCDCLIRTIAKTQNFSRFKAVFLHLTFLIVKNGGNFALDVAENLLERICILPSEKSLCYALCDIITHTDKDIFKNKMISNFENNLKNIDLQMMDKVITLKKQAYISQVVVRNSLGYSPRMHTSADVDSNIVNTCNERYNTSPVTVYMDNGTNHVEPIIKRTILFKPTMMNNNNRSNSSSGDEGGPVNIFQRWQPHNKFHNAHSPSRGPRPLLRVPRPPMSDQRSMPRPHMFQRQVSYRPRPPNCLNITRPPWNC